MMFLHPSRPSTATNKGLVLSTSTCMTPFMYPYCNLRHTLDLSRNLYELHFRRIVPFYLI